MALVKINWRPHDSELRRFGVVAVIGFSILGGLFIWQRFAPALIIGSFALAAVSGLSAFLAPKAAMPVYWLSMTFAWLMGHIMSRLLLFLIYYLLITPLALAMRLAARDRLVLNRRPEAYTYWLDAMPQPSDPRRYQRQF